MKKAAQDKKQMKARKKSSQHVRGIRRVMRKENKLFPPIIIVVLIIFGCSVH